MEVTQYGTSLYKQIFNTLEGTPHYFTRILYLNSNVPVWTAWQEILTPNSPTIQTLESGFKRYLGFSCASGVSADIYYNSETKKMMVKNLVLPASITRYQERIGGQESFTLISGLQTASSEQQVSNQTITQYVPAYGGFNGGNYTVYVRANGTSIDAFMKFSYDFGTYFQTNLTVTLSGFTFNNPFYFTYS